MLLHFISDANFDGAAVPLKACRNHAVLAFRHLEYKIKYKLYVVAVHNFFTTRFSRLLTTKSWVRISMTTRIRVLGTEQT
jgi:hypothetical protein